MKGFATCLWFDNQAEEAARSYTSIFKNSRVCSISHYGTPAPKPRASPKGR